MYMVDFDFDGIEDYYYNIGIVDDVVDYMGTVDGIVGIDYNFDDVVVVDGIVGIDCDCFVDRVEADVVLKVVATFVVESAAELELQAVAQKFHFQVLKTLEVIEYLVEFDHFDLHDFVVEESIVVIASVVMVMSIDFAWRAFVVVEGIEDIGGIEGIVEQN